MFVAMQLTLSFSFNSGKCSSINFESYPFKLWKTTGISNSAGLFFFARVDCLYLMS